MSFLYQAQLERKRAENGVDENGEPIEDVETDPTDQLPSNMPSNISNSHGGPPVQGQTKQF